MQILTILAHPDTESFNHAIAHAVVEVLQADGHDVILHDLYGEQFDAILPAAEMPKDGPTTAEVDRHCGELSEAEGIIIVHPNWWGQPPAILKGWVDRIVRPGVAYEFTDGDDGEGVPVGLLRAGTALVLNTSNTEARRELEAFGDPLETLWKNCIFGLCGVNEFRRRMFGIVCTSTPEQRAAWLDEARELARACFPAG